MPRRQPADLNRKACHRSCQLKENGTGTSRPSLAVHQCQAPAADRDVDFVEMPDTARAILPTSKTARDHGPELGDPLPQRLVGHLDAALEQHLLDSPQAE